MSGVHDVHDVHNCRHPPTTPLPSATDYAASSTQAWPLACATGSVSRDTIRVCKTTEGVGVYLLSDMVQGRGWQQVLGAAGAVRGRGMACDGCKSSSNWRSPPTAGASTALQLVTSRFVCSEQSFAFFLFVGLPSRGHRGHRGHHGHPHNPAPNRRGHCGHRGPFSSFS